MSAASMWTAMQAAIAAVPPYQGSDPVASAAYRAAVGQAMCTAIVSEQNSPVAWDGTNDRILDVGQFTSDSFTSATSMPLHIACGDGQIYEIEMVGTFTPAAAGANTLLLINNATMSGNFGEFYHQVYGASTITGGNTTAAATGFVIAPACSPFYAKATVFTTTNLKSFLAESRGQETTNGARQWRVMMDAPDTTTLYSSLGTITTPNAWTGTITVRRVA